jgi:putative salt-induced outer membrane protein YdiY
MQTTTSFMVRGGIGLAVGACLALAEATASGQEKPAEKKGWETSAFLGASLTRGNSDTFMANLTLDTKRKWTKDELAFGASGGYGQMEDETNTEYVRGFGQYNRLFNERLYGGVRVDAEYDGIAGVDYRFKASPLLGYYFIKNAKTTFSGEVGPSFVFEKLKGAGDDTYVGFRAGERFEHKLTATTRIWQTFEYIPQVDRWVEKYLLVGEIGIDAAISKKASLSLVLQDNYDSEPAPGRDANDLRLIAGVRYKF